MVVLQLGFMAAHCSRLITYVSVSLGVPFASVKLQAMKRCMMMEAHHEVRWHLRIIGTFSLLHAECVCHVTVDKRPSVRSLLQGSGWTLMLRWRSRWGVTWALLLLRWSPTGSSSWPSSMTSGPSLRSKYKLGHLDP